MADGAHYRYKRIIIVPAGTDVWVYTNDGTWKTVKGPLTAELINDSTWTED